MLADRLDGTRDASDCDFPDIRVVAVETLL